MPRSIRRAKAKRRERMIYLAITGIALGIAAVFRLTMSLPLELRVLLAALLVLLLVAGIIIVAKKFK